MTKNILAIAIAAAVMAPSAFAAATVYGLAHVGAASQDDGVASTTSIVSNSSRLGVKGSEDLAAGMKAVFQIETTVNFDGETAQSDNVGTNTTADASGIGGTLRNTFAGIGGGFGTVLLGRHDSPIKLVNRKFDLFGDQIGNSRSITGGNGTNALIDGRHNNVLAYASPSFGGFSVLAAYVPGGGIGNEQNSAQRNKADAMTFNVTGDIGNLGLGLGYINIGRNGTTLTNTFEAFNLGASYKMGAAMIVAMYQNDNARKATGTTGTRDVYGVGASYQVTAAGTIKGQYHVAGKNGSVANSGGTLMNIGYDHAMSKNTTAYVNYAMATNEDAAAYSVNLAGAGAGENMTATTVGGIAKDNSAFSVGLIHKF
jgi:predicted porin